MTNFKQQIVIKYKQQINERIQTCRKMIVDLTEDAKNDAKGSAGDKHETTLAMMHIEQEKLNQKLKEFLGLKNTFDGIDFEQSKTKIGLGSLVLANETYFLLSVSLPKIELDNKTIFAISPQAPLAEQLMGKEENQTLTMNNLTYTIHAVL
jgi:glutaredoxin-related protein